MTRTERFQYLHEEAKLLNEMIRQYESSITRINQQLRNVREELDNYDQEENV